MADAWMMMLLRTLVVMVILMVSRADLDAFTPGAERRQCKSNAHVCTSLMKYADGSEFNEGPYCNCPGCSSKWMTDDSQSLSWAHYERPDKTVQYRFCVPIIPQRRCDPGALAITMGTTTGEWSPHIREARCMCPDNKYELLGWWLHPTHKYDNKTGQWVYEYFCEKPKCTEERDPCSKIYVDKYSNDKSHMIIGYNFLCACPTGYKCPDRDEDEAVEYESDHRGTFIPRYCEMAHKGAKR